MDEYRYKLFQQHATSDKYGNCEICGKFVSDVYSQRKVEVVMRDGEEHELHKFASSFGHKECLLRQRETSGKVYR